MTVVTINNPQGIYYGVYDNAGTYTQASLINPPTHFAVLDEIPTVAGQYCGIVYAQGDVVDPFYYDAEIECYFAPESIGHESGLISVFEADSTIGGEMTGEGVEESVAQEYHQGVDIFLNPVGFDCQICHGDIRTVAGFNSMVFTLLFTDARASKDQVAISKKRRGWICDRNKEIFRSRLWLKDQSRIEQIDLNEIEEYCLEALSYMTENNICSNIRAEAVRDGNKEVGANLFFEIGQDIIEMYVKIWGNTPDEA